MRRRTLGLGRAIIVLLRRRLAVLAGGATIVALTLVIAGGVWAQEGTQQAERVFPLDNVYLNPCTGEMFRVQGHILFFREEHVDQNGTLHVTYHEVVHGRGVSETGERYVINGATTGAGQDPSSISTFVSTATFSRLGESGTEDDFVARFISVVKYDANGEPVVISQRWDSECL
jgi:glycine/D-amino acid oxidase-like deaminating enzyme